MMRIGIGAASRAACLAMLVAPALASGAAAQNAPRGFPLDREYKGVSISGFDVQRSGLTFKVTRDAKGGRIVAAGSGGCNAWSATLLFRDEEQFDVSEVVTTRKFCGKPKMTTEEAFMTTLKSAHRWRVDGNRLILEGEAGRLLLTSAGASPASKRSPKS